MKKRLLSLAVALLLFALTACTSATEEVSLDPEYEAQSITIEGLDGGDVSISVTELRELEQITIDASYQRTTGMYEEFVFTGPTLADVVAYAGGDISNYAGIGVMASDGYYCLIDADIIATTPDVMLGLEIDGEYILDEIDAPARLAVPNQFGPYWVRAVSSIVLYDEIPEKNITSVWAFDEITAGIEPYAYEYYGSADNAIELQQIFTRFDNVDSKAFFTMKSSDGFKKNETLTMVNQRYYIKYEGEDSPTNISPYIKLGMNVKNISWFSTNADAVIFAEEMLKYMDTIELCGEEGIPLSEVLYEVEIDSIRDKNFDIMGTNGEKVTVSGTDLENIILIPTENHGASVVFDDSLGYEKIEDFQRIKVSTDEVTEPEVDIVEPEVEIEEPKEIITEIEPQGEVVLSITGAGVEAGYTLQELQNMTDGYYIGTYSVVNNWPTMKFYSAEGVKISYILESLGVADTVSSLSVVAKDGYSAKFTVAQLVDERNYYPNIMSNTSDGAISVPAIISWGYKEGTQNTADITSNDLRVMLGQNGIFDPNSVASVEDVIKITLSTDSTGAWDAPIADIQSGDVEAGTEISIMHDYMDAVKIYYTTDGTEPTVSSTLYNPSTTYFQPDLTQPIVVDESMTIKLFATGFGRADSEVVSYTYTVD